MVIMSVFQGKDLLKSHVFHNAMELPRQQDLCSLAVMTCFMKRDLRVNLFVYGLQLDNYAYK